MWPFGGALFALGSNRDWFSLFLFWYVIMQKSKLLNMPVTFLRCSQDEYSNLNKLIIYVLYLSCFCIRGLLPETCFHIFHFHILPLSIDLSLRYQSATFHAMIQHNFLCLMRLLGKLSFAPLCFRQSECFLSHP